MATKKRNPNDATFRNVNALKKRVKALEHQIACVSALLSSMLKAK